MEQLIKDIWTVACSIAGIAMFAAIIGMTAGFAYGLITRILA